MSRSGADLALLLLGGFRNLADRATDELATRGYEDVRTAHDFALTAILSGADNVSELGRRLFITKQSAAKMVAVLEKRGFVSREPDPVDRRRMRLLVTERGLAMRREGQAIFDDMREQWEKQVGADTLNTVEDALRRLLGDNVGRLDSPGWLIRDLPTDS
ncbi:MarR family winged helix-turn-helix transcriptional regulator [Lentzea jiangxiensis]|uniref:DNA-binding transcriptional regulator, MarR family n=1 Tax=Lentzea jiangxiensis TaxID=641025 RepID=A0A1H0K2M9_9PSEU|nr:MarR family transcriptional regulator [Lentzea jiangxiensis]SDO50156.1 DNA-binding transcriptional regulator, MarR family [Lentzea jiangxiensis]